MKLAIHHRPGSFSDRWIKYCDINGINYKLVNCYDNTLIEQLKDCNALMWHHHQTNSKDILIAKPILFALEQAGIKVFPDFRTNWHFDDKAGQKYLLEALGIQLVSSYLFFEKKTALAWTESTTYPKVFKLRGGAGASNVKLINTKKEARKTINRAFQEGISNYDPMVSLKERWRKYRLGKTSIKDVGKGLIRFVYPPRFVKALGKEWGYVYFQDFIPGNDCDIRVVVVGDKAYAIKRMVRENDFRASGSGIFGCYDKSEIPISAVQSAFAANEKIKAQCVCFDFLFKEEKPLLLEISYGTVAKSYDRCQGYWDNTLKWHKGKFNPYGWMVDLMLQ